MVKLYKLKDGTVIREVEKGTWSIIFTNKRYILVTTWTGKVEVDIPVYGLIELGEV